MHILVAGNSGQVARALVACATGGPHEVTAIGRPVLDLGQHETIVAALENVRPDIVINAAAYTAVDQAEDDEALATDINATGPGALARACAQRHVPILHISTDYVFDGRASISYSESDPVSPIGAYGRSKLAGEIAVRKENPHHLIFRTAWVYSPYGRNFVKTMLALAETRNEISVVDDQIGCPTSAHDIADALLAVVDCYSTAPDDLPVGVFHLAGTGIASWADMAAEIFRTSAAMGGPSAQVRRIRSEDFPTKAHRPANSRLDCTKLNQVFGIQLPAWRTSLKACVEQLLASGD